MPSVPVECESARPQPMSECPRSGFPASSKSTVAASRTPSSHPCRGPLPQSSALRFIVDQGFPAVIVPYPLGVARISVAHTVLIASHAFNPEFATVADQAAFRQPGMTGVDAAGNGAERKPVSR